MFYYFQGLVFGEGDRMLVRGKFSHVKVFGLLLAFLFALATGQLARADADGAKKDIAQATTDISNGDAKSATDNLQLAEAELDGVDDATKADLTKQIADLRKKASDLAANAGKAEAKKQIDSMMDTAKQSLDSGFDEIDKDIQDFLSQDANKTALGDDAVK